MPGMDGFETASVIRKQPRFAKTPIIFVTEVAVFVELHRKTQELATLNRHLEERVVQRTTELRESEERLRLALEAAQMGTFDWNMAQYRSACAPCRLS